MFMELMDWTIGRTNFMISRHLFGFGCARMLDLHDPIKPIDGRTLMLRRAGARDS